MNSAIESIFDGLLLGFVYGVTAMGLTLIFGVMDVINLAHGPLITIGMFGVYLLFTFLGINPYIALIFVAIFGLLLGVTIYFIAVNRVIDAPPLSSLLSTFAVSMIIIGLGTTILTTSPRNLDFSLGTINLGPINVPTTRVVAAILAVAVTALLYLFLNRTRPGRFIRAVANNRDAAELVGVPSTRVLALSFGIGAMLATISGGLISTIFPFTVLSGGIYELKSFVIVVLGGLGNPIGALYGGLILGLLEGIVPIRLPQSWVPVIEFILFVVILLIRPSGLFGAKK